MPKQRTNEIVQCIYFRWKLYRRGSVWYADGRSETHNLGRHSLGTRDEAEARQLLSRLDRSKAEDVGLAPKSKPAGDEVKLLPLEEGRNLYEKHASRPVVTGGVQPSTRKKYRAFFDKFIPWLAQQVKFWNDLTPELLSAYAAFLKAGGPPDSGVDSYTDKSIQNELTTAKQVVKWLIEAGHLQGMEPIRLKVRKAESQRPYCWRPEEVAAMVAYCRSQARVIWLGDVIVALACTGLRIAELAGLRWSEVDLNDNMLMLTDQTNRCGADGGQRRLKSGRSRSFPIHSQLLDVLKRQPKRGPLVFYGPRGGRLKPDYARRQFVDLVVTPLAETFSAMSGVQGFASGRFHSFRHYFCSVCANEGVPEQMLMTWLGHADSDMVRHYYHVHDGEARRKMNGINFLGGTADGPLPR